MLRYLMLYHLSSFKNISENLRSMSHSLMLCHLSPLKNNSKNLRKSHHVTPSFSIEKQF